jgi:uncharacterized RDD family membrane protein YckC
VSTPATLLHCEHANGLPPAVLEAPDAWKAELNARLREHRERKGTGPRALETKAQPPVGRTNPASQVAARVAERYSQAPSYQELLAASAAAAAVAAQSAMEAHAAARAVLTEWESAAPEIDGPLAAHHDRVAAVPLDASPFFTDPFFTDEPHHNQTAPVAEPIAQPDFSFEREGLRFAPPHPAGRAFAGQQAIPLVEHHEPLPARPALPAHAPIAERARVLVDAFAEAVVPAAQGLPAKLIEFPRELIAPRKQRPRLAEGPLFEQEPQSGALRIFEVEASTGSSENTAEADSMRYAEYASAALDGGNRAMARERTGDDEEELPRRRGTFHSGADMPLQTNVKPSGWGAIQLGEHPQAEALDQPALKESRRPENGYAAETEPALNELAPLGNRMMAALVDAGIVFSCFLLSVLVFASCTVHPPTGKGALAISLLVLGVLGAFYGWLFMTHGGGSTPGMRYARIALCTFADENPSRKDFQNRIPATALALLPLGLGLFWALLDEDKLGWHDRMTRTYQRSYR